MPATAEATILFADIVGSTALYESAGDTAAIAAVTACLNSLMEIAQANAGIVIKTMGDAILCRFDHPDRAIVAADQMQAATADRPAPDSRKVRIGIHFGPVVCVDADVFGDTVNVAARLVALANPMQTLTSGATYDALTPYLKAMCRRLYSTAVKGRSEEVTLFEVIWRQDAGLTMVSGSRATTADDKPAKLVIGYRGEVWEVSADVPELSIGRETNNALVVPIKTASRHHAVVSYRNGNYVLSDLSSNGTFVLLDTGKGIVLRHEELVLIGHGAIGLGCHVDASAGNAIEFELR